jgi:hypothetical protein
LGEIVNIIFTGQLKPINIKACFLRPPKQSLYYLVMVPQLSNLKNTIIKDELMQQIKGMGGCFKKKRHGRRRGGRGRFWENSLVVGFLVEGT